jgi:serine phosphatase RsbU (regulator of sigma subunit)
VVLHTDGIAEARAAREFYGLEQITRVVEETATLHVDAIRDAIMTDVAAFSSRHDDDRTLVVLRYSPAALSG